MVFEEALYCKVGVLPLLHGGRLGFPEGVNELDGGNCGWGELRVWAAE